MTNRRQREILDNLFASMLDTPVSVVAEAQQQPSKPLPDDVRSPISEGQTPHPVDDDDLLLDWSLGHLSPDQHQQLLEHLAACSSCRRQIAMMVRVDALVLPDMADKSVGSATYGRSESAGAATTSTDMAASTPGTHNWRLRTVAVLATALAASLLVMLFPGLFDFGPRDTAALIAMAQRDLQGGRAEQAFTRIEQLLADADELTADHQREATALLEASGYELARNGLVQGDFGHVTQIDARVARRSGGSGRLTNLRIQAERGETDERSLARRMSLQEHYDYELDGQQVIKSLTIREITDTDRRIEAELKAAIATYPDEVDLRLNYGQLLLEQRRFQRAEAEFAAAVAIGPHNALAHTGLGLAILEQSDDDQDRQTAARALPHFQAAVGLSPDHPVIQQNLTICQNRLASNARP